MATVASMRMRNAGVLITATLAAVWSATCLGAANPADLVIVGGVLSPQFESDQQTHEVWAFDDRLEINTSDQSDRIRLRGTSPVGVPLSVAENMIGGLTAGRNAISVEVERDDGTVETYALAAHLSRELTNVASRDVLLPERDCFDINGQFEPEACLATLNGVGGVLWRGVEDTPLASDVKFDVGSISVQIGSIEVVDPPMRIDEGGMVENASRYRFAAFPELIERGLIPSGTAIEQGKYPVFKDFTPIKKAAPIYPRRARARGIEGVVLVRFCVAPSGETHTPTIFEALPPGIFDRAAILAVLQSRYEPRIVLGKPIEACGIENRLNFDLD